VTSQGTGKTATITNRKSITPYLPKATEHYNLMQDINPQYKQITEPGVITSPTNSVTINTADVVTAVPHVSAGYGIVLDSNGKILLRVGTAYATDTSVKSGTNVADFDLPGKPMLRGGF
jgi:hypothetical protein